MLSIDGRHGEGGGQILRTSLALSVVTGTPFTIHHIRGGRRTPGLLRQHLTCVRAAQAVGDARVEGASLGSSRLVFHPTGLRAGVHHFAVGSAGSTALVLQSILPALLCADGEATVVVEGGTHAMSAPPYPFLAESFLPVLQHMGLQLGSALLRPGFFPAGGGAVRLAVSGGRGAPIELLDRGPITDFELVAQVAGLPRRVGREEVDRIGAQLNLPPGVGRVEAVRDSRGPGNVVWLVARTSSGGRPHAAVFVGVGRKGRPAQVVADEVVEAFTTWRKAGAPVCTHLADQLLLPMALAGGGAFRTGPLSLHTRTNLDTLRRFLPELPVSVTDEGATCVVRLGDAAGGKGGREAGAGAGTA